MYTNTEFRIKSFLAEVLKFCICIIHKSLTEWQEKGYLEIMLPDIVEITNFEAMPLGLCTLQGYPSNMLQVRLGSAVIFHRCIMSTNTS